MLDRKRLIRTHLLFMYLIFFAKNLEECGRIVSINTMLFSIEWKITFTHRLFLRSDNALEIKTDLTCKCICHPLTFIILDEIQFKF